MSLGPSSLGNLLAQRLDTVLGISQSGKVRTGAHPDALRQSQPANKPLPGEGQNQRGKASERADGKAGQAGDRSTGVQGRQDPRVASQLQRFITDSRFTPSAPTTLGRTARTILSLLSQHANQPVQGKAPLLQPRQLTQLLQQQSQPAGTAASSAQRPAASLPTQTPGTLASASTATVLAKTIGGPTALVSTFMQALSQNVQQSGLFYESHLAQLMKGQTTPQQLQQQPQAQAHLQAAQTETAAKQSPGPKTLHSEQTATNLQQSGVEPSTQPLVRQQLELLANQLFTWRGEAWPGVPMEWEVQRRQEHEDEAEQNQNDSKQDDPPWQTRLRVVLPRLGEVEARVYIEDKSLRMHIRAPGSAEQLNTNLQQLVQRLSAQGIDIQQLQIARHDEQHEE